MATKPDFVVPQDGFPEPDPEQHTLTAAYPMNRETLRSLAAEPKRLLSLVLWWFIEADTRVAGQPSFMTSLDFWTSTWLLQHLGDKAGIQVPHVWQFFYNSCVEPKEGEDFAPHTAERRESCSNLRVQNDFATNDLHRLMFALGPETDDPDPDLRTIPPEYRTKPMTLREAARFMCGKGNKTTAKFLSRSIADGSIKCDSISRQSHIFDKRKFPKDVWGHICVTGPNSP